MTRAKVGDLAIAYIEDSTDCVGIVTKIGEDVYHRMCATLLILGWFTKSGSPPNADVFGRQIMHKFPAYEEIQERCVLPYDFEREIQWCRDRDTTWWNSLNPPSALNLVAMHFSPKQFPALQHIATARHFLAGGTMEDYKGIGWYNDEESCLWIWVTLYCHFPEQVKLPPAEWKAKNSNTYYLVSVKDRKPSVTFEFR